MEEIFDVQADLDELAEIEMELEGAREKFDKKRMEVTRRAVMANLARIQVNHRKGKLAQATAQIWNEDCIAGMHHRLPANSVHHAVTSIPFEELFTYSGKAEDVGNNGSTINIREGRFAINLRFVVAQLLRVLKPGRTVAIHIQQLLAYKNQHGFIGRRDFRGAVIDLFSAGGFEWKGEFVICKNPQAMAQRLNLHCLMFQTGYNNAANLAPAPNDYVLVFQKPGECEVSVPALYHEKKNPLGWMSTNDWVRDAHGIWTDILETDVLDGYRAARESNQEKHVCPLQLEVIRRLMMLYSNDGETVLDPFMGIGSTAYIALGGQTAQKQTVNGRRNVVGFELKESYYEQALANVELAQASVRSAEDSQPLLALCAEEQEAA